MSLATYKKKRDFRRTPEPAGKKRAKKGWSYVIQKHDASHLHYDFRLELDGVLLSWAVPKGPCLDPSQKRLAVHVEDHPVEYGGFEGIIPEGEYGGGTVMLWDRGHWEPVGDARAGYRQGKLKFQLHGEKLRGGWMLIRRWGTPEGAEQKTWFLIKERDEEAQPLADGDVLEEQPLSVATGRDLDEIADQKKRVWGKKGEEKPAKTRRTATKANPMTRRVRAAAKESRASKRDKLPSTIEPQLATLAKEPPSGDEWLHEIKFDGYRMVCRIDDGRVELTSRNHKSWTKRLPDLVEAAAKLPVEEAILDGEVVAEEPGGVTNFQSLQNAFRDGKVKNLVYYVFDLLYLNGHDLRKLPLEDRKKLLAQVLSKSGKKSVIRYSEHVERNGPEFFQQAAKRGLEGIISKRRDRAYVSGRGYDWLKVKCQQTDEFVIGGYTDPSGSRTGFGALLLGYHNGGRKLNYAGKVGTGFSDRTLTDLTKQLHRLAQRESPFGDLQGATGEARGAHWVRPQLVAQVAFSNWTRDRHLRHPSYQGLREDKPAEEVVRDEPVSMQDVKKSAAHTSGKGSGQAPNAMPETTLPANVHLSHPDKLLYPEDGITKLDLANYYLEIADWILPHLAGRPLVLVRCPDGRKKECFYQKHPGVGTPKNLKTVSIQEKSKTGPYVVVDDAEGLVSLVQIGTLEIHAWGSHAKTLEKPDRLIFDLDPDPAVSWRRVVEGARQIREFLEELGLVSFVKTTGGKGLHLVVPIARRHAWDEAKAFAKAVAEAIVSADPKHYTSNMSKAARGGKIFIDYLRNGRGSTAIIPYSTRAKAGAPVSTPLSWEELSPEIRSDQFNVRNLQERLSALKRDPWKAISETRQSITAGARKMLEM